jgi:hypothetical protein
MDTGTWKQERTSLLYLKTGTRVQLEFRLHDRFVF